MENWLKAAKTQGNSSDIFSEPIYVWMIDDEGRRMILKKGQVREDSLFVSSLTDLTVVYLQSC